jgi:hypothetical protein
MENFVDIFNDDAFSLTSLTATINEIEHVPGRAGEVAFAGVGEGVPTTSVAIESQSESLSLIQTSARGGPAPKGARDGRNIRNLTIPHIKLEDGIQAASVQGVRQFGSMNTFLGVQSVVNTAMTKLTRRHDLTIEYHRLGALKGMILDADGSQLTDLFATFGVTNDNTEAGGGATDAARKIFNFDLDGVETEEQDLRVRCQQVSRFIIRNAKMIVPSTARVWAFCGDEFFDKLISLEDVKKTFNNTAEQRVRLGANYAFGVFEYGDIVWENYRGTDDNSTVGIATDEASLFLTGVPGLYAEYFAPATFFEAVNTIGLPRYAKVAPDNRFNESVELHTQQNPLPLCLRPKTLIKGVVGL